MGFFIGFAPWILFWILVSNDSFKVAIIAAAISAIIINIQRFRHHKAKVLEIGSMIFFVVFAIVVIFVDPPWLERWISVLSSSALLLISLISVFIGKPFTIQYAKEQVEEQYWDSPRFMSVNLTITWVWTAVFLIQTLSSCLTVLWPHHETWFSWLIPMSAFVIGIKFTAWYPDYAGKKAGQAPS